MQMKKKTKNSKHIDRRRTHLTFGAGTRGANTEAILVGSGERKQIRAHYHRLHAHKSVCTHKGAGIILARARVYYFVLWGREEEVEEVEGGTCCFSTAVLRYGGPVCVLVRKEAAVRSIHPLRRFPAECDVRAGK